MCHDAHVEIGDNLQESVLAFNSGNQSGLAEVPLPTEWFCLTMMASNSLSSCLSLSSARISGTVPLDLTCYTLSHLTLSCMQVTGLTMQTSGLELSI